MEEKENINNKKRDKLCCSDKNTCSIECASKKDSENKCGCGGCC